MPEQPKFPIISSDEPPTKRKRGRPPKSTSLTSQITTRINININTSPMNSSPIAESYSNRIVKQGAPDCFTPLMRVSPSRKIKRRSSSTSTSATPKRFKGKGLISPVSVGAENKNNVPLSPYTQINPKTLDNMSFITQSDTSTYQTPPNTAYESPRKVDISNFMEPISCENDNQQIQTLETKNQDLTQKLLPSASMPYPKINSSGFDSTNNSYPNNLTVSEKNQQLRTQNVNKKEEQKDGLKSNLNKSSDFPLKLTVDGMGRAVLQTDFLTTVRPSESSRTESSQDELPQTTLVNTIDNHNTNISAINHQEESKESIVSLHSAGSDTNDYQSFQSNMGSMNNQQNILRRFNSDITTYTSSSNSSAWTANELPQLSEKLPTLPQTPKLKDNYFYSTGFTPTNNISFNLTPQFNSMMYSTMNLNSPQKKKDATNHQQFIMNQEFFMNGIQPSAHHTFPAQNTNTINMTEFISMTGNTSQKQDSQRMPLFNTTLMPSSSSSATSMTSDDSGDARFALKKIMYIKRK